MRTERLESKITRLKEEVARLNDIEKVLAATPDKQLSLTDRDARSMKIRGNGIVGYNVQTAVDSKHHLIVAHEVTNKGSDKSQLASISKQAKDVLACDEEGVIECNYIQICSCYRYGGRLFLSHNYRQSILDMLVYAAKYS